jgi:hypothetical protein
MCAVTVFSISKTTNLSLEELEHKGNLSLAEDFYSSEDLESRGSKHHAPVLNGTFLQRKNFGPLRFCNRQVSLHLRDAGVQ